MFIRRRPSAATLVAIITTLVIGTQTGFAASSGSGGAPDPVSSVEVTATDGSSVTIVWPVVRDNDVAGYTVYLNGARVGTQTPDQVKRWGSRDSFTYTLRSLACGTGYTVGVDTFDRGDRHSLVTSTTVSTAACPDTTAPSAPSGIRQVAATENSVMLSWTASSDNVGVVEYGLYASGLRVATSSDANATLTNLACGTSYLVAIDAADAAGNRSAQTTTYLQTSACPSTNKPPSTPTGLKVTAATATSVTLAWTASSDDGAVTGYGLYVAGQRTSQTTKTSADYTGLQCGTTYALGVDAYDNTGKRSTVAELSTATSPCATPPPPPPSSTGAVKQTIVNGSTIPGINDWRGVYDQNGDGVEDDPGKMEFLIDGKLVLSEELIPFGDSFANGSYTVSSGSHNFQVRALTDTGTLLATNTVTASIGTTTSPTPTDSTAPSTPGNLRVTAATASSVTVAWNASTDNVGVTGYDVYRATTKAGTTTSTSYTISGLSCGTAYSVGVKALDQAGNSSPQATMSATTSACADNQPPTAPSNVTASNRTTTSISLTWAAATDNIGVAGYGIYNNGQLVNTTTGTTGIVSNLTCGTNYTLAVDAFDGTGNSSPKTTIMVATQPCTDTTPPTVSLIAPTNGSTMVGTLNASANATDNVAVTRVEFFRDGVLSGADTSSPYAVPINTTSIADGSHTFSARAYDAAGNVGNTSNVSVTVSNTATPAPPATAFPTASTTGVPAGTSLTPGTGNMTVSTNNAVIDRISMTGCITVTGYGVTIKNSKVGCIVVDGGPAGDPANPPLTIQDVEIVCPIGAWNTGIRFDNFIAIRVNIHGCENGLDIGSHVTLRDSYIHDLAVGSTYHNDGIQGTPTDSTIEHNTIYGIDTSAIGFNSSAYGTVLIKNNLLAGGAYTLYCPKGGIPGFQVIDNRFSTLFYPKVGAYGPATDCAGETTSGNVYHETGLPLSLG